MILKGLFWVFVALNFVDDSEGKSRNLDSSLQYLLDSLSMAKLIGLSSKNCKKCNCGVPNRGTRIVGGWVTEKNEYPWMVLLLKKSHFFCGGALINDRYIATAAHCVVKKNLTLDWVTKDVKVVLAEHNREINSESVIEVRDVSKVFVHPDYVATTLDNDIALIRLDKAVVFRYEIRPICLPPPYKDFVGEMATITGWGITKEKGMSSAILREAEVPILVHSHCKNRDYDPSRITKNMLCAGDYRGRDSCSGDSGGPLKVLTDNGKMVLVGIVSWGRGCGRPNHPGIYTKVNNYLDWIKENTVDACYCY